MIKNYQTNIKITGKLPKNIIDCFNAFIIEKQNLISILIIDDYPLALLLYTNRFVILDKEELLKGQNSKQPFIYIMIEENTFFSELYFIRNNIDKFVLFKEKVSYYK